MKVEASWSNISIDKTGHCTDTMLGLFYVLKYNPIYNRYNLYYNIVGMIHNNTIYRKVDTMRNLSTRELTTMALLAALVTVLTMALTFPIPATGGYLNFGDSVIFLAAIIFGWRYGMVAGGLGAAIADLIVAPAFALPTLIVKGIMGLLVGKIADNKNDNVFNSRNILALVVGALWMATGYYLAEVVMFSSFTTPLVEVVPNIAQGIAGAIVFMPIGFALKRTKKFN